MPIHHAVLALLQAGPSHGYELKAGFEAAVGPQWGPLNIGHLYQILERLSRDGMVTSTRVAQETRPDRVVYGITEAGSAELAGWMTSPSPRTSGFRDDFFLKVMAAARAGDPDTVTAVIANQRVYLLRELRNLQQLRPDHAGDPVVGLLLAAAARHVAADLAFLDDAEATLLDTAAAPALADPAVDQPEPARRRPDRAAG
jgi:DNA-binding PadR family transcriptional regulator